MGHFGKYYVKWPQMVLTGFKFGDLHAVHHNRCMHALTVVITILPLCHMIVCNVLL